MPIFTYRCIQGHEWDELKSEGTQTSANPCQTCLENADTRAVDELHPVELWDLAGTKVPARATVMPIKGGTPKFYTNRKGK